VFCRKYNFVFVKETVFVAKSSKMANTKTTLAALVARFLENWGWQRGQVV
jgi:hypothetical protein